MGVGSGGGEGNLVTASFRYISILYFISTCHLPTTRGDLRLEVTNQQSTHSQQKNGKVQVQVLGKY